MSPRDLTFAEREGQKPLPGQLALRELSQETRSRVWAVLHDDFHSNIFVDRTVQRRRNRVWHSIVSKSWIENDFAFVDQIPLEPRQLLEYCKEKIKADYAIFFEFIELACHLRGEEFSNKINNSLKMSGSAYRFIDGKIMPISSPESSDHFMSSYNNVVRFSKASATHLRLGAKCLTDGDYRGAVRESIHSVESVAVQIAPGSKTLGASLSMINNEQKLHPALKEGFSKLYGFTNDESGIRHALIDDRADTVGESEALYMLGACASFADYLTRKFAGL